MSKVIITEGKNIIKRTYVALKELNPILPQDKNKILIKPNLVEPMNNDSGAITRKEIIEGIIKFFIKKEYEIIVGEGAAILDTFKCFEKAGYYELVEKYDVKLIDLNKTSFMKVKGKYWSFEIPRLVEECYIISAAVLKEHPFFEVTLSIKNLMGFLKPRSKYPTKAYIHFKCNKEEWAKRMCDLVRAVKPKLAIIDATTAMFGSHLFGRLETLNSTLVSEDVLACDIVGASLLKHKEVFYLTLTLKEGIGNLPSEIKKIKLD